MSETPHADAPAIPPEWAVPREAGAYRDQIRMALCRHAGDEPDGFRGPESEPGCRVIAIDILVSPSLADVAGCSLAAATTLVRIPQDTLTRGWPRKAS